MKWGRGGSVVHAHPFAFVEVQRQEVWVGRTPVGWDAVVCRVVDPAIRVVSILAAGADGAGRGGGSGGKSSGLVDMVVV